MFLDFYFASTYLSHAMSDQVKVCKVAVEFLLLILAELHLSLKGHDAPVNALALDNADSLLSGGMSILASPTL
jgi:hypothetical protein